MISNRKSGKFDSFDVINAVFLLSVFILTFYPFWNILVLSLNEASDTVRGGLYFWPRIPTLMSYRVIFSGGELLDAVGVTVARTVIGSLFSLLVTAMLAYAVRLFKPGGRRFLNGVFVFTMYFSGGLIPYYMVLKTLGLIDKFWVFILPYAINVYFMLIIRTYMDGIPGEVEESAKIDGSNDWITFWRIILPLCGPVLATVLLFCAIGQWNSWFDSYVFTYKKELKTLQAVLVRILSQYQTGSMQSAAEQLANSSKRVPVSSDSIRMATTIVVTVPIILVYPFLQKYFVKGIMIGSVKG